MNREPGALTAHSDAAGNKCGATQVRSSRRIISIAALAAAMASPMANAVDGCTVLLCLAAPSWRTITECVPPIRQLFLDLARGRVFPSCAMSGAGNSSTHTWASAPAFCPPQYIRTLDSPNGTQYLCDYTGAISVFINGAPFATTWWSLSGEAVTDFSPSAKAQLGSWDTRFDDEFAAWQANQPAPSAPRK